MPNPEQQEKIQDRSYFKKDGVLDNQEKQYLINKQALWTKDVTQGLFSDIKETNLKNIIDGKSSIITFFDQNDTKGIETYYRLNISKLPQDKKIIAKVNVMLRSFLDIKYPNTKGNFPYSTEKNLLIENAKKGEFGLTTVKIIHLIQKNTNLISDCVVRQDTLDALLAQIGFSVDGGEILPKKLKIKTAQCAAYVVDTLFSQKNENTQESKEDLEKKREQFKEVTGIKGSAWQMYYNICEGSKNNTGQSIINIFDTKNKVDIDTKEVDTTTPNNKTPRSSLGNAWQSLTNEFTSEDAKKDKGLIIRTYVESVLSKESKNIDIKKMKIGDVVGLYYPLSSNHLRAYREEIQGTINTHVGVVIDIDDGIPIISHNVHGQVYNVKATDLIYGDKQKPITRESSKEETYIVWIARPNISKTVYKI